MMMFIQAIYLKKQIFSLFYKFIFFALDHTENSGGVFNQRQ